MVPRNHECKAMWQRLRRVRAFVDYISPLPFGGHGRQKCSIIRISDIDSDLRLIPLTTQQGKSHAGARQRAR